MTTIVNASIPGTEVRTITAHSNKQEYCISVALPYSYTAHPERSYPTIYLPDAYFYFGMVTEFTRVMTLCEEEFPETIVVGIGYPMHEPLAEVTKEVQRLRVRDLMPVPDPAEAGDGEPGGGAPAFLTFIQSELIPLIEREYRADAAARVLAGHSAGGLFTLYALFHKPDLFVGYSVGSPSLYWGNRVTFAYEAAFAEGRTSLPVKLYLGIGGVKSSSMSRRTLTFCGLSRAWRAEDTRGCRLQSTLLRTATTARLRRPHSKPVYRQFFLRARTSDRRAAQQSVQSLRYASVWRVRKAQKDKLLTRQPLTPAVNCNDICYTLFRLESSKIRLNLAISDGLNV